MEAHSIGGFPPRGFQRAALVLPVYLTQTIEEGALTRIMAEPPMQFGRTRFLAARDADGSHFLQKTPLWGWIFFERLRHLASRLTGGAAPEKAPTSAAGALLSIFTMLVLAYALLNVVILVAMVLLAVVGMVVGVLLTAM